MKFKQINKHMAHVHAKSWDDYQDQIIHIVKSEGNPLMVGTILTQPQTKDTETDQLLPPGTEVLFTVIDPKNNVVVEPLEGQKIMDEGEYLILTGAIMAVIEKAPAA